jgi:membrane-bound lytic murein transglycosylase D
MSAAVFDAFPGGDYGRRARLAVGLGLAMASAPLAGAQAPASSSADPLYAEARTLFEQLPPEIRAQFDFPSPEQFAAFAARVQRALEGDSLSELGALAADARTALAALRLVEGYGDLADWLEQRIDEMEAAQQAARPPALVAPKTPTRPGVPVPAPGLPPVPHYELWLARVKERPLPARAPQLLPRLRAAFVAEGVPPELVWLAEAESSFNPVARSPVGAKGLFQFMPETAKAQGLSTLLPDERTDPEKSARAAARYLRYLHSRFGNWALALAAYNAGEGRVSRTLASRRADSFTAIADALPAETRMYVPKVLALTATRAGVPPHQIPSPRR